MRFEFVTAPTGGLRVIPRIPDPSVCLIEGYNGIGKTMSVRLLQLCTGQQPYAQQRLAWETLRISLGQARITAEGLDGASTIEWVVDSRRWPPEPGERVDDAWLGAIHIDGEKARLTDVRQLLEVHRIAGDVSLTETLARQADGYADQIAAFRARMLDPSEAAHRALDLLGKVEGVARRADSAALDAARRAANEASRGARAIANRLAHESARLTLLEEAADIRRRISLLRETGPAIESELRSVEFQLNQADEQRDELAAAVREAEARAAASEDAGRQLRNARRTAERNQHRLAVAREELAETLAAAALDAIPTDLAQHIREQREIIDGLLRRRAEVDATPVIRNLLRDLVGRLSEAIDAGLGDQVILLADDTTGAPQTVEGLRQALNDRVSSLPPDDVGSAAARSLDRDIAKESKHLQAAEDLQGVVQDAQRWQRLTDQAGQRMAELTAGAAGDGAELERLRSQLKEIDKTLLDLAARRVLLRRQRQDLAGGADEAELASRLAALLEEAKTDEDRLAVDHAAVAEAASAASEELAQARIVEREAEAALATTRADLHRAVTLLHDTDEFAYLRRRSVPLPREHDEEPQQAAQLAELLKRSLSAQARLQDVPNRLSGMRSALADIAAQMRNKERRGEQYQDELKSWLEKKFGAWFRQPTVVAALFPGAEDVRIDLDRQAVVWHMPGVDGESLRPFNAFSSGQQAFAYTRAQLEALGPQRARNRLIALDEFGAFVAHNRRGDLQQLLTERSARNPHEKTLVILPVTQDYEQLAKHSARPAADRYAARAASLRTPDEYFAEEFVP